MSFQAYRPTTEDATRVSGLSAMPAILGTCWFQAHNQEPKT